MRTEDGALIYKCLNEEPDAFGMLVDKYKAGIFAFVYNKLGNFQDAEDVTQETFLEAFKNLRKLRNWDSFAIWLFSIASNLSKKWICSLSRRPDRELIEDKDPKVINDPSIELYRDSKISESLREALDSLPDIYRQVLTLHYLGGMSGLDIARSLGISHDTVRQRLLRARVQLKEEMIAMISQTFQQQKLSASFTFQIVEMLKKIRIQPNSNIKGLPWGLSLGTGLIFAILMFGQHIQINLPDITMGLPFPSEMKVLEVGEIPVDVVKVSTITSIGNKGDGKGLAPDPKGQENAFLMAPQGEGGKWEQKADIPTARVYLSSAEVNGKIYVMGGFGFGNVSSANEMYDPELDKWTIKANMPSAQLGLSTTAINGKIYAIGGYKSTIVQEYDPISDSWEIKTPMPSPKQYHSAVEINNKIYIFGGWSDILIYSTSIFVYDPTLDQWSILNDIPNDFQIFGSSAIVYNDKVYFFGGVNINNRPIPNIVSYDLNTETWQKKASIVPRVWGIAEIINDKIYFIGGTNNMDAGIGMSNVEEYDIATDTISEKLEMPNRRGYIAGCAISNQIFIIGGTTDWPGNLPNDYLSINEVYTPDTIESVDPNGKLPKTWGMLKAK